MCAKLSQWMWILPQLSYKESTDANNLIASVTLWHHFTILEPLGSLIMEIQRNNYQLLLDSLALCLCSPSSSAGENPVWAITACTLLQSIEGMMYDKHFFMRCTCQQQVCPECHQQVLTHNCSQALKKTCSSTTDPVHSFIIQIHPTVLPESRDQYYQRKMCRDCWEIFS